MDNNHNSIENMQDLENQSITSSTGPKNNKDGEASSSGGGGDHSHSGSNSISSGGSGSATSSGRSTGTGGSSSGGADGQLFAAKEDRNVKRSRYIFMFVLFIFCVTAGVVTYLLSTKEQEEDFTTEFTDIGFEVSKSTERNAQAQQMTLQSLAMSITNTAQAQNATWPMVTVPNFHVLADQFAKSTGAETLFMVPVIVDETRELWNEYSTTPGALDWYKTGLEMEGLPVPQNESYYIPQPLEQSFVEEEDDYTHYLPLWQTYPTPRSVDSINRNLVEFYTINRLLHHLVETGEPALSKLFVPCLDQVCPPESFYGPILPSTDDNGDHGTQPHIMLMQPITQNFDDHAHEYGKDEKHHEERHVDQENNPVVAIIVGIFQFDAYLQNVLHEGANGVEAVVKNSCGDIATYLLNGPEAVLVDGLQDTHSTEYERYKQVVEFEPFPWHEGEDDESDVNCHYEIEVYPTTVIYEKYHTNKPAMLTLGVVIVFAFTCLVFFVYDRFVQMRQEKVLDTAQRSNAIVASLFPAEVRKRLMYGKDRKDKSKSKKSSILMNTRPAEGPKFRLNNFLNESNVAGGEATSNATPATQADVDKKGMVDAPIADLFPNTTVLFADIAGFTAWASVREPTQVFTLLETVYSAFDSIAKRRRVFKVETIGDCYVAVTGLPEARDDHAVLMAKFARECLTKMSEVTGKLEVTLGPETGELAMRFGLHSGPVTAGVLRGEKSRFQLFGDTVNTAARMESNGIKNKIHCSTETAEELIRLGKEKWIEKREDMIEAKGKGKLQTYWILSREQSRKASGDSLHGGSSHGSISGASMGDEDLENVVHSPESLQIIQHIRRVEADAKNERLARWITDLLVVSLKEMMAARPESGPSAKDKEAVVALENTISSFSITPLDEIPAFVPLPKFEEDVVARSIDDIKLDPRVEEQVFKYVMAIGSLYRDNPFHNFEHCSHVAMSVRKLLSRIVSPENPIHDGKQIDLRLSVDDNTYGITSDKMAQFAVIFGALIHDVDHRGIPNFVLGKEDPNMATKYKGKAIAEQRSVDLAWSILMSHEYKQLRECIYTTREELHRFRQLVVNTVLATDIFDPDLGKNRKDRWNRAFGEDKASAEEAITLDDVSRKSTIVVEHLIQASDVAHTMQHWQVYVKWNERLFQEMYAAYKEGRTEKDPSEGWFKGELWFFDNYVLPLTKKLEQCQVFGVSSDEYYNYAKQNRHEWETRGHQMVEDFKKRFEQRQKKKEQELALFKYSE